MRDYDYFYTEEASKVCNLPVGALNKKLKCIKHPISGDPVYRRKDIENYLKLPKFSLLPKPTDEEMLNAAKISFKNSNHLLEDSKILYSSKRYSTAYSICAIALEELGKAIRCIDPIVVQNEEMFSWKSYWDYFYNHHNKLEIILLYIDVACFLADQESISQDFAHLTKRLKHIDAQKQNGFYVDYIKSPRKSWFEIPSKLVKKSDAKYIIDFTSLALNVLKKQKLFSYECISSIKKLFKNSFSQIQSHFEALVTQLNKNTDKEE